MKQNLLTEEMEVWMKYALEMALKGKGKTRPNPMVGAVIVKDGQELAFGWHDRFGGPHAEVDALSKLEQGDANGADLYVTLEPCCHFGKTPPCTEAIIKSGIKRVLYGMKDPNPMVSGKGLKRLEDMGIDVIGPILEEECKSINRAFNHRMKYGKPFVIMKAGMTLDGKIAAVSGESKWITGEESRREVHRLRGETMAVMTGIGTVLADDPLLNCRYEGAQQPIRIIIDKNLDTPVTSQLIKSAKDSPVWLIVSDTYRTQEKIDAWLKYENSVKILQMPCHDGRFNMDEVMRKLSHEGIESLLVEGGGRINESMFHYDAVDEVRLFLAPLLIGGSAGGVIAGSGAMKLSDAIQLENIRTESFGSDICVTAQVKRRG